MECTKEGCTDDATFELHIPWTENESVCAGHARVAARREGIVAEPLDTADENLPEGASSR